MSTNPMIAMNSQDEDTNPVNGLPPATDLPTILASLGCCDSHSHSNRHSDSNSAHTYRMPAEWEPHSACLILFPHNPDTFRVDKAAEEILGLALAIATEGRESVVLLCRDAAHRERVAALVREKRKALHAAESENEIESESKIEHENEIEHEIEHEKTMPIRVAVCPSNDTWARDTAPTFVVRTVTTTPTSTSKSTGKTDTNDNNNDNAAASTSTRELIGLDWDFNAYGGPEEGAYWPCTRDQAIARTICSETTSVREVNDCDCDCNNENQNNNNDDNDSSLPGSLSIASSLHIPLILEGGSIHTDGEGTLLATAECLLHQNRNPHLCRLDLEAILQRALGISKILWLPYGLDHDDDTNGHVDNFCCFVRPGHVVLAWTDHKEEREEQEEEQEENDGNDEKRPVTNYERCRIALDYLQSQTDARGRSITVTKLHLPHPGLSYTHAEASSIGNANGKDSNGNDDEVDDEVDDHDDDDSNACTSTNLTNSCTALVRQPGEPMAASYVNYYVANGAVLVPQFGNDYEESDERAIETLKALYCGGPTTNHRTVVGIPSREILLGGGNIHCQTQQVPAATNTNTNTSTGNTAR